MGEMKKMANQFLGLSMFIMLLSFFIMLTSLSNYEEVKARPVMNSVSLAFSSKEVGKDDAPAFEEIKDKKDYNDGDTLDNIEALFKAQISGYKLKHDRVGSSMHVRIQTRVLERAISAASRSDSEAGNQPKAFGGAFLPVLVSLMQSGSSGVIYRMDMVLNVPKNPMKLQNDKPKAALDMVKTASSFSRGLERAGLPKKLMSSGIAVGKKGYIDLYFRRYEPFNPYGREGKSSTSGREQGL